MAIEKGRIDPEVQVRSEPDAGTVTTASTAPPLGPPYPESASPEDIRRDIERTRAEMDSTFDALSDRMSPRHMLDEVFDFWHGGDATRGARRGFKETGTRLAETVRDHPVPTALIGAGLVWLLFEDKKPRYRRNPEPRMYAGSYVDARTGEPYDDSYGAEWRGGRPLYAGQESSEPGIMDKMRDKVAEAGRSVKEAVSGVGEKAGETMSEARERMARMGEQARGRADETGMRMQSGYRTSRRSLESWLDEAPLAAGVAALAAGLAAGLLLPETRRENELFGEASDRLKEQAREAGSELMERGSRVASETAQATAEEARKQDLGPQGFLDKAERVLSDVKKTAVDSAEREGIGPSDLGRVADTAKETAKDETRNQKDQMRS